MQYSIPQFIEVEDKVIGPLTIRQFLIILFGGLLTAAGYSLFDFGLFLFSGIIFIGVSVLFAFVKINGQKLEKFVVAFFQYQFSSRVRHWAKDLTVKSEKLSSVERRTVHLKDYGKDTVSRSKLHELSIMLDTASRNYESTATTKSNSKS